MLADDTVEELEDAIRACNEARSTLIAALEEAEAAPGEETDPSVLEPVGGALRRWRDAQRRFMEIVERSAAPDPATAVLLLKTNHGIDPDRCRDARCGIPGTDVEGADQPFDLDLTGPRAGILTKAATEHLS